MGRGGAARGQREPGPAPAGASGFETALFEDEDRARDRVAERLARVRRAILVSSGKGGVGKSAIAVNLAAALARTGRSVGVLDADLYGPSVGAMLGLRGQPVRVSTDGHLIPVAGPLGLRVQSMDFFLQGNEPLDWEGPAGEGASWRSGLEQAALVDLLGRTEWGELDALVVDLAPGADRLPALARWLPPMGAALAVTIPTSVALLAVERSLRRAREARIPVIGLVENFAGAVCPRCGAEAPMFREAPVEDLARRLAIEVVARVPFDAELAAAGDAGRPLARGSPAARALDGLAQRVDAWQHPGAEGEAW